MLQGLILNNFSESILMISAAIKAKIGYYAFKNLMKLKYYQLKAKKYILLMPFVYNEISTLKEIAKRKCSIARFGDGETALCNREGIHFQEYNDVLAQRLKEILKNNSCEKLLVCIAPHFNSSYALSPRGYNFVYKFFAKRGQIYINLLNLNYKYGSALISRPDVFKFEKKELDKYVSLLRNLWNGRDLLIVTGKNSRFVLSPELFDNIKSNEFIYGLSENAFVQYEELLNRIKSHSKDKLVLLAMGPTATVLAYDLAKEGYQAIDIGHLPSCYQITKNILSA